MERPRTPRTARRSGVLVAVMLAAAAQALAADPIVRLDRSAEPKAPGRYPPEMVEKGAGGFDGSYLEALGHRARDGRMTVAIWQSGPGVLKTDAYPHDEYCLVLEGELVVTNAGGGREVFRPGDSFVIPKGWAGTWDMKTRFKKQYVAVAD